MKAMIRTLVVASFLTSSLLFAGTTGKIAGTVTDARSGEKLVSANVIIEGTTMGATTSVDGYYVILNIPPGTYRVKASLLGYKAVTTVNVRVEIDQTTSLDFKLEEEAVKGEEVTVVAERPVVQRDVAASQANIQIQQIQNLPVANVASVVTLQAGIRGDLVIRGGGKDQTAFVLDGLTLRDERTNEPYMAIALSSIEDVQIQSGGFTAEYGDLRSGVVNVVTKEGSKSKYSFTFTGRYAPARPKHFGPSIYDPNSYWIRPYVDPAVAWTGTGKDYDPGAWDKWTRDQYPYFEGWNSVAQKLLTDPGIYHGLTPQAAQQLFLWEYRKQAEITKPDWDVDMGFGGPFPVVSEQLGNLRFYGAYRKMNSMYLVPLSEPAYVEENGQLKVTTDLTSTMKLALTGLWGRNYGTNDNNTGLAGSFQTPDDIAGVLSQVSYIDARIFATDYWAPTEDKIYSYGAKLSHTLSSSTFYEVTASVFSKSTSTNPGALRDTTGIIQIGPNWYDEAPFGYQPAPSTGITGLRMGVGFSNSRDTSSVTVYDLKFDLKSQLDRYNQVSAGFDATYSDDNVRSASTDIFLPSGRYRQEWHTFPYGVGAYAEDKLEFEGMVANVGLRLDYMNPNGKWYVYDPYNSALSSAKSLGIDTLLLKQQVKATVTLSPRLGISFPISEAAKLFFNYGHYRQRPFPQNLFLLRRFSDNNQVNRIADPTAPFPKTIMYELGYEHSLFDQYLLRVSGYYKDVSDESFLVEYQSRDNTVDYFKYTSNLYEDIRGAEFSVNKNRGNWIQGFANYTYEVITSGYFGYNHYFQDPTQQRQYQQNNPQQTKPIPQPYARADVTLFTPPDYGPEALGIKVLGDWRVNLLGSWRSGFYFSWAGGGSIPGLVYNEQWVDFLDFDMRVGKTFKFGPMNMELFADISNLFNRKYMSQDGFVDGNDYNAYMMSLHLPDFDPQYKTQIGYVNIPGDDRPGSYRKDGVDYQPIVAVATHAAMNAIAYPNARPFYYVASEQQYYHYVNGAYQPVDQGKLQQVLDDKAYIDMPNQATFTFLNPRQIFFGLRLSFDL